MGYIYKITNTITGKCYIGQTREETPEKRWKAHRTSIKSGRGCIALINSFRKHGLNNFKFEVLIICFDNTILEMEKYYIKKYNSLTPNGYNIIGDETDIKYKKQIIIYENEVPRYYTFRKIREHTEETRSKISCKVNEYYENGGIEKQQQAMAKAVGIKVNKYNNNNNLLESYDSIKGAARANNIPQSTLNAALKYDRKAGGFVWRKMPKEAST
jgi:group I intron endonuclease